MHQPRRYAWVCSFSIPRAIKPSPRMKNHYLWSKGMVSFLIAIASMNKWVDFFWLYEFSFERHRKGFNIWGPAQENILARLPLKRSCCHLSLHIVPTWFCCLEWTHWSMWSLICSLLAHRRRVVLHRRKILHVLSDEVPSNGPCGCIRACQWICLMINGQIISNG